MKTFKSINWNKMEDVMDKLTYEKLCQQFWLSTRMVISNDISDWSKLSDKERDLFNKVFGGLTMLDTLQSEDGIDSMKKDVRTQHETAVLSNISFMECYTTGHDVLTPDGWVDISKISIGDDVLQYDDKTKSTSFEKVLNTSSHFAENIYHIYDKHKNTELKVSEGHRMIYEEKVKKDNSCKDWKTSVVEAKDFVNLPKTGLRRLIHIADHQSTNDNKISNIERLFIALQADGNIKTRAKEKHDELSNGVNKNRLHNLISLNFQFSKDRKINRLRKIISDSELDYTETIEKSGKTAFDVKIPFDIIKSTDKKFNNMFSFANFNKNYALDFLEELGHWDSHTETVEEDGRKSITYYTTDKDNADFVMAVSTIAGVQYHLNIRKDNRKDNYKDTYAIRINFDKKNNYSTLQSIHSEIIEGDIVYGIEVPSSYLVIRSGASTIISGNCEHARSYSSIFSTLCNPKEIDEIFSWTESNEFLQYKANTIQEIYATGTPLQKKIASVFLESFLFYSGFYTPLYYLGKGSMVNVAEVIRLIIRDESVHGTYLGYKFQQAYKELSFEEQSELMQWSYALLADLYKNEVKYTQYLYDDFGWTEDVKTFLKYNANKALMNLGIEPMFEETKEDVNPIIMNGISTSTSNHDFFSSVGNGYLLTEVESMKDSDYDY